MERGQIPQSNTGKGLVRLLEVGQVVARLRKCRKPNSRVEGDLPRHIANQTLAALAVPLTLIYNTIRPISMTPLWSKVMESYVEGFTLLETRQNWKPNQQGGRSGSCTDHVLIEIWDKVLRELDSPASKAAGVSRIDISKSYLRCSYQLILKSYIKLGAAQ